MLSSRAPSVASSRNRWSASATGPNRVCPGVPSQRGAFASSVANIRCTTITAPAKPCKRRDPVTLPPAAPQKVVSRAFTRSAAVRPLCSRSNAFVARGIGGDRRRSNSHGSRAVRPCPRPALHFASLGPGEVGSWVNIEKPSVKEVGAPRKRAPRWGKRLGT